MQTGEDILALGWSIPTLLEDLREAAGVGFNEKQLVADYRKATWHTIEVRLAADGSLDFNTRRFGFHRLQATADGQPATREELPNGELLTWRAGPSVMLRRRRFEYTAGLRVGTAQVVGDDKHRLFLEPSASATWVAAFLDPKRVDSSSCGDKSAKCYRRRAPKFSDDGGLPPRLVLGLRGTVAVPVSPPDFQRDQDPINSASVLVHADFVVSDKLKFRIGVPITAELVEQTEDDDPVIAKATGIQWSVPAFAATVLAF